MQTIAASNNRQCLSPPQPLLRKRLLVTHVHLATMEKPYGLLHHGCRNSTLQKELEGKAVIRVHRCIQESRHLTTENSKEETLILLLRAHVPCCLTCLRLSAAPMLSLIHALQIIGPQTWHVRNEDRSQETGIKESAKKRP
eukprot:3747858-Amphidinium_carterae.1